MKTSKLVATLLGLLIAAFGVLGMADPSIALGLGQQVRSTNALYLVAAVRVLMGAVLVWAAPGSRMPRTLLVIGVLMMLGGLATPIFGVERIQELLAWFSSQGALFMRAAAGLALALGAFIVFAVRAKYTGQT